MSIARHAQHRGRRCTSACGFLLGNLTTAILATAILAVPTTRAQRAPAPAEIASYSGLLAAAALGDAGSLRSLMYGGADPKQRDSAGRTALHVAAFGSHYDCVRALATSGGDINALENDRYDVITIAAVRNDVAMVKLALELGGNPKAITSVYDGSALIAAAHLGHFEVVRVLIDAGAPLDHVNNLGWTALIEAVVLGDGGPSHVETARALIKAGANKAIGDRRGVTPLEHARQRGYRAMIAVLE